MTFIALAVTAGVGLYAANQQRGAADDARRAGQDATDQSIAEQQRQYDQSREDQLPFLNAGYDALDRQQAYLNGDVSGFANSPDYKWSVEQGTQGINRAAIGNLSGGGTAADLVRFGQGNAQQFANNYWAKLAGRAGQGQGTAQNLGASGMGMANSIGNYLGNNAAQIGRSSYARADANSQLAAGIGGQINNWWNQNQFGGI